MRRWLHDFSDDPVIRGRRDQDRTHGGTSSAKSRGMMQNTLTMRRRCRCPAGCGGPVWPGPATRALGLLTLIGALLGPATAAAQAPDLSANWIRGGQTAFSQWEFTAEGRRKFESYDFKKDDPAYGCIGASWTRVWLNPNVLVKITQAADHVRLQYEWMDIDRRIPLVDPTTAAPARAHIATMPALGHSAAWYDGDALVIDTVDFAPGYITTMEGRAGMPQSRRMRTVERIRRSGDTLTIETTHVDPTYYRNPVVTTIEYRKTEWELMEYGCTPEAASLVSPR